MVQEHPTFAFRWLLPITQLLLCVVALWPLRTILIQQLSGSIRAYRPQTGPKAGPLENHLIFVDPLSPEQERMFEKKQAMLNLETRQWIPQALNLPCGLVQLPYVILNPAKQEWIPRGMDFKTWRVVCWPLAGVLFWWIAGRGIEGLIAARHQGIRPEITWIEAITSAALCAFCAVAAVCMPLFSGRDGHFPMKLFVSAFGMWSVLGGLVVAARVAQWRLRRRPSLNDDADVPPASTR
jgi:hypothetical protein